MTNASFQFHYLRLANRRPRNAGMAEGEGFEPPKACTLVVFKTTAIDHSAIPPASINNTAALTRPDYASKRK